LSILPKLMDIYRRAGYEPLGGYNPYHFNGWMDAPFTVFFKDGTVTGEPGMALQEVMLLEGFADYLSAKNILVIGNSFGWSTIALALIFPDARVLALDPIDKGNALTRTLAKYNGLRIEAIAGKSPDDLARLRAAHLSGPPDIVLIDAQHNNDAMLADFRGSRAIAHDGTVWVFHDVMNWNMVDAFQTIRKEAGLSGSVLTRTPSGVAVTWKNAPAEFEKYIGSFTEHPDLYRAYRQHIMDRYQDRLTPVIKKL
jgi:predicted O-methyltransferase YrrM